MSLQCKTIQKILIVLATMTGTCAYTQSQTPLTASPTDSKLTAEQLTFFESKIRPVLVKHCYSCHGPEVDKVQGGLRLDQRMGWQSGGDSGNPSIIPGDPNNSPLMKAIQHDGEIAAMPPDLPPLPETVVADFKRWIEMAHPIHATNL